jgi:hypothetical protein
MPEGLTPRATVLLVALVFGLAFGIQALLGGNPSPSKPAAEPVVAASTDADVAAAPPDLRLVAAGTVPALRDPRKPPKQHRVRKPKRSVRKMVVVAPKPTPKRVATPKPVVTPAPRYIPPAPRYTAPAPRRPTPVRTPAPRPAPTTAPTDSGEFDTTGEP